MMKVVYKGPDISSLPILLSGLASLWYGRRTFGPRLIDDSISGFNSWTNYYQKLPIPWSKECESYI